MEIVKDNKSYAYYLYGQSTLRRFGIIFKKLKDIAPLLLKTTTHPEYVLIEPLPNCKDYVEQIQDICEKFDFLRVSRDTIFKLESHLDHGVLVIHVEEAKFFFYMFIFNLKSLVDSISMLLRNLFSLNEFSGGQIDLVRNYKFREVIPKKSDTICIFLQKNESWINIINEYRDNLIHRNRIPIFIKELERNSIFLLRYIGSKRGYLYIHITDTQPKISHDDKGRIGVKTKFSYVAYKKPIPLYDVLNIKYKNKSDFVSILELCNRSFSLSKELIEISLNETYNKIS